MSIEVSTIVAYRRAPHGVWRARRAMRFDEHGHLVNVGLAVEELIDDAGEILVQQELSEEEFKIIYPPGRKLAIPDPDDHSSEYW